VHDVVEKFHFKSAACERTRHIRYKPHPPHRNRDLQPVERGRKGCSVVDLRTTSRCFVRVLRAASRPWWPMQPLPRWNRRISHRVSNDPNAKPATKEKAAEPPQSRVHCCFIRGVARVDSATCAHVCRSKFCLNFGNNTWFRFRFRFRFV
jgi:hypothetical protein